MFGAAGQHRLLAGQEHGSIIPSADTAPTRERSDVRSKYWPVK
jgi:hypothetical protein